MEGFLELYEDISIRIWHDGLRQVLMSFSIKEGLVRTIQELYNISSSAVLLNSQI